MYDRENEIFYSIYHSIYVEEDVIVYDGENENFYSIYHSIYVEEDIIVSSCGSVVGELLLGFRNGWIGPLHRFHGSRNFRCADLLIYFRPHLITPPFF